MGRGIVTRERQAALISEDLESLDNQMIPRGCGGRRTRWLPGRSAVAAQDFACPAAEGITERLAMKKPATGNLLQAIPNPPFADGPGDDPRHGLGIRLGLRTQQL